MKKIKYIIVCLVLFGGMLSSQAQMIRFGVKGGANLSNTKVNDVSFSDLTSSYTGLNAGVALNVKLLLGFSLQPELLISNDGMSFANENFVPELSTKYSLSQTSIMLPVNVQWGIKLGPVRPFAMASPFVGHSLKSVLKISDSSTKLDINDFTYGMGVGFGLDLWKLQLYYKYKWNINTIGNGVSLDSFSFNTSKFQGSELSLIFFL